MTKRKCMKNILDGICITVVGWYVLRYCWTHDNLRNAFILLFALCIPLLGITMTITAIPTYLEKQHFIKEQQAEEEKKRIQEEKSKKFLEEKQKEWEENERERKEEYKKALDRCREQANLRMERNLQRRKELRDYSNTKLEALLQAAQMLNNKEEHSLIGEELHKRYSAVANKIRICENEDEINTLKNKLNTLDYILRDYNNYETIVKEKERQEAEYKYQLEQNIKEQRENEHRKWEEKQKEYEYQKRLQDMEKTNRELRNSMADVFSNINDTLSTMERESKRTILNPNDRQKLKDATRTIQSEMNRYK